MLLSKARKRDVVSTATATRIARVEGFVVLPDPPRLALLRLGKVSGGGTLLAWDDVRGFGPDAVTVRDAAALRPPLDPLEQQAEAKELDIIGKQVLSERGDLLGRVSDVDVDPETGAVTTLVTDLETIAGERLIGVGRYAAVVSLPPTAPPPGTATDGTATDGTATDGTATDGTDTEGTDTDGRVGGP